MKKLNNKIRKIIQFSLLGATILAFILGGITDSLDTLQIPIYVLLALTILAPFVLGLSPYVDPNKTSTNDTKVIPVATANKQTAVVDPNKTSTNETKAIPVATANKQTAVVVPNIDTTTPKALSVSDIKFDSEVWFDHTSYVLYKQYDNVNITNVNCEIYPYNAGHYHFLKQEKNNTYDSNAVMIVDNCFNNYQICDASKCYGYIYKGALQDMANDFINRGDFVRFISLDSPLTSGVLGFYKKKYDFERLLETQKYTTVTVSKTKNEEIQQSLNLVDLFQEITIDYDEEKEIYFICDPYELGKFPKSKTDIIERAWDNDLPTCISEINEDDNGIITIKIAVFED